MRLMEAIASLKLLKINESCRVFTPVSPRHIAAEKMFSIVTEGLLTVILLEGSRRKVVGPAKSCYEAFPFAAKSCSDRLWAIFSGKPCRYGTLPIPVSKQEVVHTCRRGFRAGALCAVFRAGALVSRGSRRPVRPVCVH